MPSTASLLDQGWRVFGMDKTKIAPEAQADIYTNFPPVCDIERAVLWETLGVSMYDAGVCQDRTSIVLTGEPPQCIKWMEQPFTFDSEPSTFPPEFRLYHYRLKIFWCTDRAGVKVAAGYWYEDV